MSLWWNPNNPPPPSGWTSPEEAWRNWYFNRIRNNFPITLPPYFFTPSPSPFLPPSPSPFEQPIPPGIPRRPLPSPFSGGVTPGRISPLPSNLFGSFRRSFKRVRAKKKREGGGRRRNSAGIRI